MTRPGKADTDSPIAKAAGPICNWRSDTEDPSFIGVTWQLGNKHGLADLYRERDKLAEYFIETSVGGHPAIFYSAVDNRAGGDCEITVGVSDALTFTADESGALNADQACARAKQVAAAIIVTLKESQ